MFFMLGNLLSLCRLATSFHFVKNEQFHGTFFINLTISAFYVGEYMNFKVFEFKIV
jgi:hypothetical protein